MEPSFWLARWQQNQIGFHEQHIHPMLLKYWGEVVASAREQGTNDVDGASRPSVFVPLCGKSLDMLWLIEAGCDVIGVELSELAVEAFFTENKLPYTKTTQGPLQKYENERVTLWCGDIFDLSASQLPALKFFYDRAALVALPIEMRRSYVAKINSLVAPASCGLLVALEYEPNLISPPPHSVPLTLVASSYGEEFDHRVLGSGNGEVKGKPCLEHAVLVQTRS